ncbi:MAG: AAA family ATPase [Lachnospiraceae bacterium]|nr:AAA family ATPase [Lachnospiraceae bacterium]
MRYYNFVLGTNASEIEKNTKVRLRDYEYSSTIGAVNNYMYQKMRNGLLFFVYRDEPGNVMQAVFSYDERSDTFDEAYSYILDELSDVFGIKKIKDEPAEISIQDFYLHFQEARRRLYTSSPRIIINNAGYRFYHEYLDIRNTNISFDLSEKIINENRKVKNAIYDKSLVCELDNIKQHKNLTNHEGNIVHYVISAKSIEAAGDMVEALASGLAAANRISGRRVEIFSNIGPRFYQSRDHVEDLIENNYGGVIVLDLSEKFGHDITEYDGTCKYIVNTVKKYKNDCLFVFVYNIDAPGFSYGVLPDISDNIFLYALREGKGDRRAAVNYMKQLIKESDYSDYAGQANEFMKQFPEETFTQTDVLKAYEGFDSWCLNKNVMQAYNYDNKDIFMLDRDDNASSYDRLKEMIGLKEVKQQIDEIITADIVEKERRKRRGSSYNSSAMHMVFAGNPGTAKTTVAKLFAGIAKDKGILKSGAFVERGGMDLDGFACLYKIRTAFKAAKGGVLFIDEAYSLKSDAAVTVLIQEMENHREDVIVILAGYNERMKNFMELNEGLKSRVPYWIDFPDYNADELTEIFKLMLKDRGFTATEDAIKECHYIFDRARLLDNFGNGRYVRNLLEKAVQKQASRLARSKADVSSVRNRELFQITKKDIAETTEEKKEKKTEASAREELNDMIGLTKTKAIVNKAIAGCKLRKICENKGIQKENGSMHMVFTGNPGTAKTTVARLFAEIMKDEKVLTTGAFVECGRADLVGQFIGHTAPIVKKKFREAQGGVLFIDEAYSLCDDRENSFGDEAINTIVQEMENNRDKVIVIFAGYPDEMKHFLERNPGLSSRIAYHVEFDDYSTDELLDITRLMISKKQMSITDTAMAKLRNIYESMNGSEDFGNGRFVRKIIEEAELNLADRLLKSGKFDTDTEGGGLKPGKCDHMRKMLTTIEEADIPEPDIKKENRKIPIGFAI